MNGEPTMDAMTTETMGGVVMLLSCLVILSDEAVLLCGTAEESKDPYSGNAPAQGNVI